MTNRPAARPSVVAGSVLQVEISRHGAADVLRLRPAVLGPPGPGEVRLAVRAAGVNFADVMARIGLYAPAPPPPLVPGFEVAGTVVETGPGVDPARVGERVIAGTRFGGYSSQVVVKASRLLPLPESWSFEEGAGFLATYATAWHALVTLGRIEAGAWVLLLAGAGGLGTAATQVARQRGARVVACAGGPDKARFCESIGAERGVDYLAPGWPEQALAATGGRGFDLLLDTVMGREFGNWRRLLRPNGHLVLAGAASFTPRGRRNWLTLGWKWLRRPRLDLLDFISSCRTVSGFNILLLWQDEDYLERLGRELTGLMESGAVRPVIDRSFPAERAGEAHDWLQGRRTRGKVVLMFP